MSMGWPDFQCSCGAAQTLRYAPDIVPGFSWSAQCTTCGLRLQVWRGEDDRHEPRVTVSASQSDPSPPPHESMSIWAAMAWFLGICVLLWLLEPAVVGWLADNDMEGIAELIDWPFSVLRGMQHSCDGARGCN
ncbi:MAG: hypothetical protein JWR63_1772 [Conexibacter sp.]|nr:hypothetical protein [Conexibacter sp.]